MLKHVLCGMLLVTFSGNALVAHAKESAVTRLPANVKKTAVAANETKSSKAFSLLKLHSAYKNTGSLSADFTQEVYQPSLARTKTSQGSIKLSKPNWVRWETYEPEASVMVSNGRKLFYFTPNARGKGKGQVIESKAKKLEEQPLFRILTGSSPLDKEFTVENEVRSPQEGQTAEIQMKPKKAMGDLLRASLKVNSKYLIEEIILETQSGVKTKITLQNQALGSKLPAQIFEFKPPADTEVVQ